MAIEQPRSSVWLRKAILTDAARIAIEEAAFARYVARMERWTHFASTASGLAKATAAVVSRACRLSREYFTPADIAAYVGLSTYTVQDLCRRGELRHVRVGRSIRIKRQWAEAFMQRHEREPL